MQSLPDEVHPNRDGHRVADSYRRDGGQSHAHFAWRMMAAIKRADPAQLDGIDATRISLSSVRVIGCTGRDEEPTEVECVWQTRGKHGWTNHKSWLATDGGGWRFIDR